jgi:Flp pilus assembly protein TadG
MIARTLSRAWKDERGQSLAEFALILPVLLLLIAGIIEFGRGWNISQVVADAAREGARSAVVADNSVTPDSVAARILRRLQAGGTGVTTLTHVCPVATTVATTAAFCTTYNNSAANANWRKPGIETRIDVAIRYRMPFLGALMRWATGTTGILIGSSASMRNE